MLYKVTPMMAPPQQPAKKVRQPGEPRKKRKSAVYDHEGHEVLVSLMCLKCKALKPLAQFGLRKMADGAIRNQPWCRTCRSGAGTPKPKPIANPVTARAEPESSEAAEVSSESSPEQFIVATVTGPDLAPARPADDLLETTVDAVAPVDHQSL